MDSHRFLNVDLPSLSSICSIRFVVLLPLILSADYGKNSFAPQSSSSSTSSSSSSESRFTQRACVARLNLADLKTPLQIPADAISPNSCHGGSFSSSSSSSSSFSSSSSSSSSSAPIAFTFVQNRRPFNEEEDDEETKEDEVLEARNVSSTLLAVWKADATTKTTTTKTREDQLAFVSVNVHHHRLVGLSLNSTMRRFHDPNPRGVDGPLDPHRPYFDDLDTKFGLHDFDCAVDLRHQRKSLWQQMFQGVFCREQIRGEDRCPVYN